MPAEQLSLIDLLDPPLPARPDYMFGRCDCGWLLAGWHCRAWDQPGWQRVRHLWIFVP